MDDVRLKRIRHRAWRRGFKEADLVLGPFADAACPTLTADQLDAFEALLEAPDPDIYAWVLRRQPVPAVYDTEVLRMIRAFHGLESGA
jgi:antitoxin CptB